MGAHKLCMPESQAQHKEYGTDCTGVLRQGAAETHRKQDIELPHNCLPSWRQIFRSNLRMVNCAHTPEQCLTVALRDIENSTLISLTAPPWQSV